MLYEYLLLSQTLLGEKMCFEDKLREACEAREVPVVVLAADGPGNFHYQKAFGTREGRDRKKGRPLEVDATFSLASCTAIMTTVAALQCVERGLLTLDEDVVKILPELRDVQILTGFDQRTQTHVLSRRSNQITLRHLLTHTSGISHPAWNCRLYEYLISQTRPVALACRGRISNNCCYPLIFEPGTSWEYGAGIDWAGKMVERVNGGTSLQEYMDRNIWTPLNISTATFRLDERLDLKEKLPKMMYRQGFNHPTYGTTMSPGGRLVPALSEGDGTPPIEELPDGNYHPDMNLPGNDDYGGSGAYCSAPDFAKILHSLCVNDSRLLQPRSVTEMFTAQLLPPARARLQSFFMNPHINNIFAGGLPVTDPPLPLDWGLGGLLVLADVPADVGLVALGISILGGSRRRRSKGSMFWSGLPNLYWWMDPAAGTSGFWASQLLPQGDPRMVELFGGFEEWVYGRVAFGGKGH